ncbi:MAG: AraC family transcriptional regulator [Acidobacteria bacterium]|nr:MAG: AraC family transcriptional regulator [Acidobacteriota bacterium]
MFPLRVAGIDVYRSTRVGTEVTHALQQAAICILAQGSKSIGIGESVYQYDAGQFAVFSIDVPVAVQVTRATPSEPYLVLRIALDAERFSTLAAKVYPDGLPQVSESRPVYIGDADPAIVDAANRLLKVITQPTDAELLASFAIDEIIVRLLRSPMGARIAHIGQAESGMQKMARAVSWLRANYKRSVDIPTLANLANVSVSSFHRHFKAVTSMSPLQYQKALRLQEARRLMLTTMLDAGSASRRVGYASASQFSREYARFFGAAPIKDIQRLREQRLSPTASSANILNTRLHDRSNDVQRLHADNRAANSASESTRDQLHE